MSNSFVDGAINTSNSAARRQINLKGLREMTATAMKNTTKKAQCVPPETTEVSNVLRLAAAPKDMGDVLKKNDVAAALKELLGSFAGEITSAETDVLRSKRSHFEAVARTFYSALLFIKDHEDKKR